MKPRPSPVVSCTWKRLWWLWRAICGWDVRRTVAAAKPEDLGAAHLRYGPGLIGPAIAVPICSLSCNENGAKIFNKDQFARS
ncbi:hypothetical protein GOBAR_DD02544 [Gossypium barbadense]|nr:hypothetical protein GOBAR_DD02544 [Gossypium barbadense]